RLSEALAEARLAQELDPASVAIRRAVGWAYYYARRYDEAAEHLRRAAALNPTSEETRRVSGLVALARGEWVEAEAAFREALSLSPTSAYSAGGLGAALARAGRTTEAREILTELTARRAQRYVASVPFAMVHIALGETDAVFADIARAHAERRGWMAYLRVDPLLDPLRGDPRFGEWLRRMRL
ncbi:MAG TPA: tetratricopeptide repeat protein, partial [Gemmatimonadales bacterium]|nr:tetratricopeptide repeat protein [Gemmatimonadales bacterium]